MVIPVPAKPARVYADTSVFGGSFDAEFARASRAFFEEVRVGRLHLVLSTLTVEERLGAPERVRAILGAIPRERVETHPVTEEMERLKGAYLSSGILGPASDADALHVAAATVLNVDVIVSWNFKHIVHFEKIRAFNAVNRLWGYKEVEIYSPMEIVA